MKPKAVSFRAVPNKAAYPVAVVGVTLSLIVMLLLIFVAVAD
jgi:hypothetical protein